VRTLEESGVLSTRDIALLQSIKNVVQGFLPTATVLLYGSVARGGQHPESDYDMLVLTEAPLLSKEEDRIDRAIYDLELAHEVVISTTYQSKEQWEEHRAMPFHIEVDRDAIVL
jgi:predicted nucleotidyltransferase